MILIERVKTFLATKTDAELQVTKIETVAKVVNEDEIDVAAVVALVIEGKSDWQIRTSVKDKAGLCMTPEHVKQVRAEVAKERAKRDAVLNAVVEEEVIKEIIK